MQLDLLLLLSLHHIMHCRKINKQIIREKLSQKGIELKFIKKINNNNNKITYPLMLVRPYVVFNPTTPQREEGIRTEPGIY